jgi:hypothetical protein
MSANRNVIAAAYRTNKFRPTVPASTAWRKLSVINIYDGVGSLDQNPPPLLLAALAEFFLTVLLFDFFLFHNIARFHLIYSLTA